MPFAQRDEVEFDWATQKELFEQEIREYITDGYVSDLIIEAILRGQEERASITITANSLVIGKGYYRVSVPAECLNKRHFIQKVTMDSPAIEELITRWKSFQFKVKTKYLLNGDFQILFRWDEKP